MVRVKNRYLVVNILYPTSSPAAKASDAVPELLQFHAPTSDAFHTGQLVRLVREGITELFGDYGMGMANRTLKVTYWSPATSTAIIRCPREHYEMVWAALTFTTKLPRPIDTPVVFKVVRVSGTIRKAEEEVIRRSKGIIRKAKEVEKGRKDRLMEGVVQAVEKRGEPDAVLAQVDEAEESESDSD
ncbi:hypothetical protein DPSP01_008566 [Paraphaeosphaeria sporulosa]|uniref:Ribonuclease P/MRP protein subunit POP5 n=1 Tax=Paraphaeosphaeria sporulosa TaxID=1460663 RepID=A0A177CQU3_9PLEO|nr:uncharacterized protein CC84DRAFT_1172209 [Paraphaeosphaeria sporulosa]OAG09676.1 hypothetical protein CC84DRAFT_1172209 [Paraphaeosphaeria sporulosa]